MLRNDAPHQETLIVLTKRTIFVFIKNIVPLTNSREKQVRRQVPLQNVHWQKCV